ncbi:hypothetical protein BLA29_013781, partial [Euroglyphus maynei]
PCDINLVNLCSPYSGTTCRFNKTSTQIECECIHFENYGKLVKDTSNSSEQNGLIIHECKLSADVCAQTCPLENDFSGSCKRKWSNLERKLQIECDCKNDA